MHLPDHLATAGRQQVDATSVLTLYAFLLMAVPSKLVFAPLGGAGTPAQIVGIGCAIWYLWCRLQRPFAVDAGPQPVRTAMGLFVAAVLISYVGAMARPISAVGVSSADLGLVGLVGWLGVVLIANDGISSLERLWVLLRRIAAMGGGLATVGIAQFFTGRTLVDAISIPGLTINQTLGSLSAREGFNRPAGTAVHPIEFGVVLTVVLPIALACAMSMRNRSWIRRWYPTIAIAVAIPLSISRTAIIGTIVSLAILLPTWPKAARRTTAAALVCLATILFVAVPGFLGTITGLFTTIGTDTSAQSRTGAVGIATEFIERSPIIGRGFATFLPSYWILDNQYLGLAIELGIVGIAAVLWLLGSGIRAAIRSRRVSGNTQVLQVGQALAASVASGAVSAALFDLLGFPMSAGILFLVLGLSGCLWRLARLEGTTLTPD